MNSSIKEHIRECTDSNPVIVEIGAHYGEDTMDFLKIVNPSHIYCFEPDPRNTAIFKKHVSDPRVTLVEYAVSNEDEEQVCFYPGYSSEINPKVLKKYSWISEEDYLSMKLNASGASSLKTGHPLVMDSKVVRVPTTRLDTWMWKNPVAYVTPYTKFLWIDVQGAEREVIEGLGGFSSSLGGIWIEYGEMAYEGAMDREETISLLSEINFEVDEKWSSKGPKGNLLFWRCR